MKLKLPFSVALRGSKKVSLKVSPHLATYLGPA